MIEGSDKEEEKREETKKDKDENGAKVRYSHL